ncbi:hypothetical protein BDC45DRAFT_535941 [Circinella umbellata]|nr:hypothetical protein BDC45DRAFT_535941 [Circinella umbellata]
MCHELHRYFKLASLHNYYYTPHITLMGAFLSYNFYYFSFLWKPPAITISPYEIQEYQSLHSIPLSNNTSITTSNNTSILRNTFQTIPLPPQQYNINWHKFWKSPLPHSTCTAWWKLLIRRIPTRSLMHHHMSHLFESNTCLLLCNTDIKSTSHFLFTCASKQPIWHYIIQSYSLSFTMDRIIHFCHFYEIFTNFAIFIFILYCYNSSTSDYRHHSPPNLGSPLDKRFSTMNNSPLARSTILLQNISTNITIQTYEGGEQPDANSTCDKVANIFMIPYPSYRVPESSTMKKNKLVIQCICERKIDDGTNTNMRQVRSFESTELFSQSILVEVTFYTVRRAQTKGVALISGAFFTNKNYKNKNIYMQQERDAMGDIKVSCVTKQQQRG